MLLADSLKIEIDTETLRAANDDFQCVLLREASTPGYLDAFLFLLLMAKAEQNKPGTIATMTKPEAEVV